MIGKKIKVNDYKFTYGEETVFLYVYSAFKDKRGNKYTIYSYENKPNKLYYGSFFERNIEAVVMTSKENPKNIIKDFIDLLIKDELNNKFEILSLDKIETMEIIDEYEADFTADLNKLYDITIPKPVVKEEKKEQKQTKNISIAMTFFILFLIVVIAFFFFNPEVIIGKDKLYSCTKSYLHNKLPASITEEIALTFSGKSNILNIDLIKDYKFNNTDYYTEFRDKGYFYQYMEENDTYKFIDEKYTYRLFSKKDIEDEESFLPTKEEELMSYYQSKGYTCKRVETYE